MTAAILSAKEPSCCGADDELENEFIVKSFTTTASTMTKPVENFEGVSVQALRGAINLSDNRREEEWPGSITTREMQRILPLSFGGTDQLLPKAASCSLNGL